MVEDIAPSKTSLRKALRAKRRALSQEDVAVASGQIVETIIRNVPLNAFRSAALYWPIGKEVDLRGLADESEAAHLELALPVVMGEALPLQFYRWRPGDPLEPGRFGERVPAAQEPVRPELIFVPVVGFDRSGHRLGQGGGFYDRTLADLRNFGTVHAIGVAFCVQECLNVAQGNLDEPLERLVTEREIINF